MINYYLNDLADGLQLSVVRQPSVVSLFWELPQLKRTTLSEVIPNFPEWLPMTERPGDKPDPLHSNFG